MYGYHKVLSILLFIYMVKINTNWRLRTAKCLKLNWLTTQTTHMVFFKTEVCIIILKMCLPFEIVDPIIACNGDSTVWHTIMEILKIDVIVYCVKMAESELFQGIISSTTEIVFPHESHILFFCHASGFIDDGIYATTRL